MASAEIVQGVSLELTRDEADTLFDVLRRCGGMSHTRARHLYSIADALERLGYDEEKDTDDITGEIMLHTPGSVDQFDMVDD
jgi:hypothetical protein